MDNVDGLRELLNEIILVLEREQKVLIRDDGEEIVKIVEEKTKILDLLKGFKGIDISGDKGSMELIEEINELQETNLLLTEQALSFQNMFMDTVTEGLGEMADTYSATGDKKKSTGNLVDRSV